MKLVKTPLKVGFLYREVVYLLFSQHNLTSRNEKSIFMFMFESKFDMWIFCVHIFNKLFQLLMRIKGDRNIINMPLINVKTKILWAIREIRWLRWVLAGIPWQHHLISNNTRYQIEKWLIGSKFEKFFKNFFDKIVN